DLTRDDDHRRPSPCECSDQSIDLRARADVDSACRFIQQENIATVDQPAGKHRLLLVSPREGSDRAVGVRRGELERLDLLAGRLFLGPFIEYSPMRESTERRQGDGPVNRLIQEQSPPLATCSGAP